MIYSLISIASGGRGERYNVVSGRGGWGSGNDNVLRTSFFAGGDNWGWNDLCTLGRGGRGTGLSGKWSCRYASIDTGQVSAPGRGGCRIDDAGMSSISRGDAIGKWATNDLSTSGRGGCSSKNSKSKSDSESSVEHDLNETGRGGCSRDNAGINAALNGVGGPNWGSNEACIVSLGGWSGRTDIENSSASACCDCCCPSGKLNLLEFECSVWHNLDETGRGGCSRDKAGIDAGLHGDSSNWGSNEACTLSLGGRSGSTGHEESSSFKSSDWKRRERISRWDGLDAPPLGATCTPLGTRDVLSRNLDRGWTIFNRVQLELKNTAADQVIRKTRKHKNA